MLIATFTFGQEIQKVEEVEVTAPLFTGVENAIKVQNESANALIRQYLKDNIIYPEKAKLSKKEGTEVVQFTVTEEGNVADFKIINSICPEIDYEIIRALKNTSGMWFPGYNNGKPVEMTKEVSLVFCLDNISSKSTHEIFSEKAIDYFNIGNINLFEKQNPKKAIKYYTWGINYLPYDNSLLLMRGMCRYELGEKEGAREDWNRMTVSDEIDMSKEMTQMEEMKGYNEMMAILNK